MAMPWDLFRRGELDKQRHHDKVRDAIQKNLKDLIGSRDIMMDGAKGKVRLPVREFREHRFRYADGQGHGVGSATPRPGKGDVIGRLPGQGESGPGEAGEGHERGYYEAEIGLPEVAAVLFADLELPNLREVEKAELPSEEEQPEGLSRRGALSQLDLRRTLQRNILRHSMQGRARVGALAEEDLYFRDEVTALEQVDRVAAFFLRDRSGSMGEREKLLSRLLAFWTLTFLRQKYRSQVTPVYILHDTQAEVVEEDDFFHRTAGGGTAISSGYALMAELISKKYPPSQWNLYVLHLTDGDNIASDNSQALNIVNRVLPDLNLFCYCEVSGAGASHTYYSRRFSQELARNAAGQHPTCEIRQVPNEQGVIEAVRHFFRKRGSGSA